MLVEVGADSTSRVDDEAFDQVAEFLAQLDESSVKELGYLFTQLTSGQSHEFSLAQTDSATNAELGEDRNLLASYLAQLNDAELEELKNLVEVKATKSNGEEFDLNFA